MASIATTLLLLAISTPATAACNRYLATGPAGNQTYNNYAYYDFRHLGDQVSGTPVYSQDSNFDNGQFALSTSPYFNSSIWTTHWSNMNYKQPANHLLSQYVDTVYTPLNVAIEKDNTTTSDTVLSLTTTRLETYSPSALIQSIQHHMHASLRMSARMLGPPGACGTMYFFGDNNDESDMELLTNDSSPLFHATNHPSQDSKGVTIPGASDRAWIPQNGTANGTANGTWTDWNDWRMDWLPDRTQWIVNGVLVVDKTYHPPQVPATIGISMWSNGGTWTGNMTVGQTATLQVRWIEVVFNTTTDKPTSDGDTCVVQDNSGASNAAAQAANPVSLAVPKSSSSLLAWLVVTVVSILSLL